MTQYDKEYRYVEHLIKKSITTDELHHAQRTLRDFIDLWVIKVQPTDPKFIKDRNTLTQLMEEKSRKISKSYLS